MLFLSEQPHLNETDTVIYHFVMTHLDEVPHMSTRALALETATSTASVVRFCKKFGVSGFSEFKMRLKLYLAAKQTDRKRAYDHGADEDELISFFSRVKDSFYRTKIDEAAQLLMERDLVIFLGIGSSAVTAEYGALYFSSMFGLAVRIGNAYNYPIEHLSNEIAKRTCVIALSVSGETKEIVEYVSHPNLSQSSTISITNNAKSTLARVTDLNIPYYVSKENNQSADITTQVPALFIIEKLAKRISRLKGITQLPSQQ